MSKKIRHIVAILLALQVVVASTGATFYRHYCNTEGELLAISVYKPEDLHCSAHHHESHHDHDTGACDEDCCNLSREFRKTDTAAISENLKKAFTSSVLTLPERIFGIPLPALLPNVFADTPISSAIDSPPFLRTGKTLLPFIRQFRL